MLWHHTFPAATQKSPGQRKRLFPTPPEVPHDPPIPSPPKVDHAPPMLHKLSQLAPAIVPRLHFTARQLHHADAQLAAIAAVLRLLLHQDALGLAWQSEQLGIDLLRLLLGSRSAFFCSFKKRRAGERSVDQTGTF